MIVQVRDIITPSTAIRGTRGTGAAATGSRAGPEACRPSTARNSYRSHSALPMPGSESARLMKSVVITSRPLAAAALSRPVARACVSSALAWLSAARAAFCCLMMGSI